MTGIKVGSRVQIKSQYSTVNGTQGVVTTVLSCGPYPYEVTIKFPDSDKPLAMPFSESELVLQ